MNGPWRAGWNTACALRASIVLWANNGQRALALARSEAPHLILLDIRLPDISGFDVCRTCAARARASRS